MIDPAMVRPGRLDKLLYVDLPKQSEISEILRTLLRKVPLGTSDEQVVDMSADQIREEIGGMIAGRCDGYSGADLAALVREAGVIALKRTLGALDEMDDVVGGCGNREIQKVTVGLPDFVKALDKVTPSVSVFQRRRYQNLRSKFAGLPVRVGKDEDDKRVDTRNVNGG
jgi:ribosome biogenesis ATPase